MARRKKNSSKKTSKRSVPTFKLTKQHQVVIGSLLVLIGIAMCVAFISYFFTWQDDQSTLTQFADRSKEAKNILRKFGAAISHFFIYKGFGIASFILAFLIMLTGTFFFLNLDRTKLVSRWFWGLLVMMWLSVLFGFIGEKEPLLGGTVGFELNDLLQSYIGKLGVVLLLTFILITYLALRLKLTPEGVFNFIKERKEKLQSELSGEIEASELATTHSVQEEVTNQQNSSVEEVIENKKEPSVFE